jgi:hypothetical protein
MQAFTAEKTELLATYGAEANRGLTEAQAQKNKEQEDLERTLNTPLETFGTTPMDDLKAKYDNQDNNQS